MFRCTECGSVHSTCSKRGTIDGIEWFCPDCNGSEIEEVAECCGDDCTTLINDGDWFCRNCEKDLQDRINTFLLEYNDEEKEYMIKYVYEKYLDSFKGVF